MDHMLVSFGELADDVSLRHLVELEHAISCHRYVDALEKRSSGTSQALIFEMSLEIPSRSKYFIHSKETLAVVMNEHMVVPRVYPCRLDFPQDLAHLNQADETGRESLCLSELPSHEQALVWNPADFLAHIKTWLEDSARGDLHRADQPLEPVFFSTTQKLVVDVETLENGQTPRYVSAPDFRQNLGLGRVLSDREARDAKKGRGAERLIVARLRTQSHGRVWKPPTTLEELWEALDKDIENLKLMGRCLQEAHERRPLPPAAKPYLVLILPLSREDGSESEKNFLVGIRFKENLWQRVRDVLNKGEVRDSGTEIKIDVVSIVSDHFRRELRSCNGLPGEQSHHVVLLGAGALGSPTIVNLLRQGYAESLRVVDMDFIMPHNLARHDADRMHVGLPKALYMAYRAQRLLGTTFGANHDIACVLNFDSWSRVVHGEYSKDERTTATVVLDLTASRPVTRHLATLQRDANQTDLAQVLTGYLSPSGKSLTLLVQGTPEAQDTLVDLTTLEMESLLMLCEEDSLAGYYSKPVGVQRYGNSCTDISSQLRQAHIAMFSGILTEAIEECTASPESKVIVWHWNDQGLQRYGRECRRWYYTCFHTEANATYTIHVRTEVLEQLREWRQKNLPNETGGYLIGHFDHPRRTLYVARALPAPSDSRGTPRSFERGEDGVRDSIEHYEDRSLGTFQYLGEWHSHPNGCSAQPSAQDQKQLEQLQARLLERAQPAVMLIVASNNLCIVVGEQNKLISWNSVT